MEEITPPDQKKEIKPIPDPVKKAHGKYPEAILWKHLKNFSYNFSFHILFKNNTETMVASVAVDKDGKWVIHSTCEPGV